MKQLFRKLENNYQKFMYGRYGVDNLYRLLSALVYILLIALYISNCMYLFIPIVFLIVANTYRCLSKNYVKRNLENQSYLKIKNSIISFFKSQKRKLSEKNYVFRRCPHCKQRLRLPKKKGQHEVNCPKCHNDFKVRI